MGSCLSSSVAGEETERRSSGRSRSGRRSHTQGGQLGELEYSLTFKVLFV